MLRGINVGGKCRLPMKDLVVFFEKAGCSAVRTYLQSGNVVFRAPARIVRGIAATVTERIATTFGFAPPILLRTDEEIAAVASANPFERSVGSIERFLVLFLADEPSPDKVARLDCSRSPPDAFLVRGGEIYLHCPNGFARTKLTNDYFDRMLETTSTGRNWRTVLKLLDLCRS